MDGVFIILFVFFPQYFGFQYAWSNDEQWHPFWASSKILHHNATNWTNSSRPTIFLISFFYIQIFCSENCISPNVRKFTVHWRVASVSAFISAFFFFKLTTSAADNFVLTWILAFVVVFQNYIFFWNSNTLKMFMNSSKNSLTHIASLRYILSKQKRC